MLQCTEAWNPSDLVFGKVRLGLGLSARHSCVLLGVRFDPLASIRWLVPPATLHKKVAELVAGNWLSFMSMNRLSVPVRCNVDTW